MAGMNRGSELQFGSFSLGDVFEQEIRRFGEFAFRGKHTKGEASRRFVKDFVKNQQDKREGDWSGGRQGAGEGKNNKSEDESAKIHKPISESPERPTYPFGTCIEHLFTHSWSNTAGSWIWVKKGEALSAAELGLGFPARKEEIRRFGSASRRITRALPKWVDDRSFAEVAAMDAGRGRGQPKRGGMGLRPGDRAAPGRFAEERGADNREGNFWNRERNFHDLERERAYGQFGGQGSGYQGGFREDRGKFDQQRVNPNKRQFEDRDRMEWEEQELRAKLKRGQEEWRPGEQNQWNKQREEAWEARGGRGKTPQTRTDLCFNCNLTGHLRKDCSNPPYCYCCKRPGHRSSTCPEKKGLKLYGFGIPGQGFYNFHLPNDREVKKKEVLGFLQINYGQASPAIIERELNHLYPEVKKWAVKQLHEEGRYLITFPNEEIRNQMAKFKSFEFETANIKAKVIPTQMSAGADGKLDVVWIRAYNIPPIARKVETVMEIANLAGDPEEVDVNTLEGEGPIRIRLACRDASQIRGETQVYFNGDSHRIRWEVIEGVQEKSKSTSKFDRHKDREDEEKDNEEGEFHGDSGKGGNGVKESKETNTNQTFQGGRDSMQHQKSKRCKIDPTGQEEGQQGYQTRQAGKTTQVTKSFMSSLNQESETGGSESVKDQEIYETRPGGV
jgi:hypothetical protein